jgi:hypothetical protein
MDRATDEFQLIGYVACCRHVVCIAAILQGIYKCYVLSNWRGGRTSVNRGYCPAA